MDKHVKNTLSQYESDFKEVLKIIKELSWVGFKILEFLVKLLIKILTALLTKQNLNNVFNFTKYGLNLKSKISITRLVFSSMATIYLTYKISQFVDIGLYSLLAIPVSVIISGALKSLWVSHKVKKYNEALAKCNISGMEIFDLDLASSSGWVMASTTLPISAIDKELLGVALNTTIVSITNPNRNRQVLKIEFDNDKTFAYNEIDKKNVVERLEAVLLYYKIKNSYISSSDTEIETQYTFFADAAQRKLLRLTKDIQHKLALGKKSSLKISFEAGNTIFTIRKEQSPIYYLDNVISNTKRPKNMLLPFIVGCESSNGKVIVKDLTKFPHALIGGMTNTGKSVTLNGILDSLLYWNYENVICFMTDFKEATLTKYKRLANCQYVGDSEEDQVKLYEYLKAEYEKRKKLFSETADKLDIECRDIHAYNKIYPNSKLPYIVVVTEEINTMLQIFSKETLGKDKDNPGLTALRTFFFTKGRSLGFHFIDSVQKATDGEYSKVWRASIEQRICHKMSEDSEVKYVLQHSKEIHDFAMSQHTGEFLYKDEKSEIHYLKGCFINESNNRVFKTICEISSGRNPRRNFLQGCNVPDKAAI